MMNCSIKGCGSPARYKGLCGKHYKRAWRHGDPNTTLAPTRGFERIVCIAEGCSEQSAYSNGLCDLHYQRQNRYGRLHNIIADKGAGGFDTNGYYLITVGGKRVYEHTHKAEQALGKPLPPGAVVHHMNGVKHDNDTPFNLVVCPDQAYHLLLHRRAKELGYENP